MCMLNSSGNAKMELNDNVSVQKLLKEVKAFIHNINEREKWFFFYEGELYLKKTKRKLIINQKMVKEVVLEISHISIHNQNKGVGTYIVRAIHNMNTRYNYTVADRVINLAMQAWVTKHKWILIESSLKEGVPIADYYLSTQIKM